VSTAPRVRIKVCGLTSPAEASACVTAGVDWIGLNFHPGSPRRVDPARAADIVAALPSPSHAVGLFVDRPPHEVAAVAAQLGLEIVQLHGNEPPADLLPLSHLKIVRAFRIRDAGSIEAMLDYLRRCEGLGRAPDAILLDAHVDGLAGGTGQTIAADLLAILPQLPGLILAGGLTPDNVAERVQRVRPWMVDVASSVESAPGRKDLALVAAFVRSVTAAGPLSVSEHP
jgi:phosphoribosylanthranilate isomerase